MFLIASTSRFLGSIAPTRSARRLVEVAAVALVSCLAQALFPIETVNWANFDRARVGMTSREVRGLFARRPDEELTWIGRVADPKTFLWATPRGRGAGSPGDERAYRVEVWEIPSLTVVVIYDAEDRVACRVTGGGQVREGWAARALRSARDWAARLF